MSMNDMGDLIRNAQKIRKDIDSVQSSLKDRVVEGKAGDGLVSVLVNGQQEILKVSIDPKAVSPDPEDVELLEDLIMAAISQGIEKSKELKSSEINKVTGGLGEGLAGLLS